MVSAPRTDRIEVPSAGESGDALQASISAISWPAIFGGAFAAAAFSLILLALGSGFGLASVSPWSNSGASATTFTVMTAIWLIVVQWVSAGLGGYLTGRLRTKWVGVHTHEVFFRDTANGLLTWAVAAVIGATVLASAVSSLLGGGTHAAATIASAAAAGTGQAAIQANPPAYLVDSLFRSDHPNPNAGDQEIRAETGRILGTGIKNGDVPAADRTYLAQLVAARTGLSQADAEKRVDAVIAKAKAAEVKARQVADAARKAGAYLSIFTAVSMLIGAFVAAAAAALGAQHRDEDWRASGAAAACLTRPGTLIRVRLPIVANDVSPRIVGVDRVEIRTSAMPPTSLGTLAVAVVIVVSLYFGREVFVPVALALLLSFALGPLVLLLRRRHLGRLPAVIAVVLLAFSTIGGVGTFVGTQLAHLAGDLPEYQSNIAQKIHSLRTSTGKGQRERLRSGYPVNLNEIYY